MSAKVQVKVAGIPVGWATIYSDGRIACNTRPGEFGKQVYELCKLGFAEGISIVPITIPAIPAETQ